jgi:hypothetical protein
MVAPLCPAVEMVCAVCSVAFGREFNLLALRSQNLRSERSPIAQRRKKREVVPS